MKWFVRTPSVLQKIEADQADIGEGHVLVFTKTVGDATTLVAAFKVWDSVELEL